MTILYKIFKDLSRKQTANIYDFFGGKKIQKNLKNGGLKD